MSLAVPPRIGDRVDPNVESNLFRIMGIGLGLLHRLLGRTLKQQFDRNPVKRFVSLESKPGRNLK